MSGITGTYNFDGRPADPSRLGRMLESTSHRGPDGRGALVEGPLALGQLLMRTSAHAPDDARPRRNGRGTLALVFDGRVDNRRDVQSALGLRVPVDADLVICAYERWGEGCFARLIGDFALALWDAERRALVCARDVMGVRPFVYSSDAKTFVFGSELCALLEGAGIDRRPNEAMVGEYLALDVVSRDETLYARVSRLPPAHLLRVTAEGVAKARYWDLDPPAPIRYATDADYAAHFNDVFREAVRCRLESTHPVAVHLSGGLDSSSVTSVAASLHAAGEVPAFTSLSLVFPGADCDESGYIADVVGKWRLDSAATTPDPASIRHAELAARYLDFPGHPNGTMGYALRDIARQRGCRVTLTGTGGDDWLQGTSLDHQAADALRGGRVLEAASILTPRSMPGFAAFMLRRSAQATLPRRWSEVLRRHVRGDAVLPWIDRAFARRVRLAERLRADADQDDRFGSWADRALKHSATSPWVAHALECEERSSAWYGIEDRHPFEDRRLIDFVMAIPEGQRLRQGATKVVLREAMRGLLPESVRLRTTKATFGHVGLQALEALGGERAFRSLAVAEAGWVDEGAARRAFRRMTEGLARGDRAARIASWPLWMVLALELWKRGGRPRIAAERGQRYTRPW